MFRKFVLALSLVGLLGVTGVTDMQATSKGSATISCFDCWEMKAR